MPHRGGDLARHAEDGVGSQGQDPVEEVLDPDQEGALLCHHVVSRTYQDWRKTKGAEPTPEVGGEEVGMDEVEFPFVQKVPYSGDDGEVVAAPLGNERHRNPQGLEVGSQLPPGLDHQDRGPDFLGDAKAGNIEIANDIRDIRNQIAAKIEALSGAENYPIIRKGSVGRFLPRQSLHRKI